ncbi:MAG: M60 family metallopeptidase [Bacteroidaceae bacterium]|nr:M60 family metallopeptidase [Bacteroidaceae bacterium]
MRNLFKRLTISTILCSLFVVASIAQPTSGGVYRFDNKDNSGYSLAATSLTTSSIKATVTDGSDYSQLWLLETHPGDATAWTLRNLGNGLYLQHAGQSTYWGFVSAASSATALYYVTNDAGYCSFNNSNNTSGYTLMHYASTLGGVVGWEINGDATQWTMVRVEVDVATLQANWEALDAFHKCYSDESVTTYQTALDNLFSDKACTTLKKTFTDATALEADADYSALPDDLQAMVKKVWSGNWEENNYDSSKPSWSSEQAKKFRLQMYEPYSIAGEITSFLGINAHINMDNPTGIFSGEKDVIYVMVEGEIAEGSELWLCHQKGRDNLGAYNSSSYTKLKQGLNAVPYLDAENGLWINYVVHTYNSEGTTVEEKFPYKISDFAPLKIHIAGGHVNGFYNSCGDFRASATDASDNLWGEIDNDDDWNYYEERNVLLDFVLVAHRQVLKFNMNTTPQGDNGLAYYLPDNVQVPATPYCNSGSWNDYTGMSLDTDNGKINIMLEAWDRIMHSELATMGLLGKSQMDKMNEMYPRWYDNWQSKGEIYDYTDYATKYCEGRDYGELFNHHGLAWGEYVNYMYGAGSLCGYHHNTMGSIIGTIATEPGSTWGPGHEIGHQHQAIFTLNGLTEVTNNLHANVAVWYMGMATSRVNGSSGSLESVLDAFNSEDNDYYTNNIWALTHFYYKLWLYYHLAGNNTQFYPRLFELLRQDPMVRDYNQGGPQGLLKFYRHCCDAAGEDLTEYFRSYGLLEVMDNRLVGDYSNSVYTQTQEEIDSVIKSVKDKEYPLNLAIIFINDATTDVTYSHNGTTQRTYWDGETANGDNADMGSYVDYVDGEAAAVSSLTLEGTTMTVTDASGVGIAILNADGELIGFSNKTSFEISGEVMDAIMDGTVQIVSVGSETTEDGAQTTNATYDLSAMQAQAMSAKLEEAAEYLALVNDNRPGFYKSTAAEVVALQEAYNTAKTDYDNGTTANYSTNYNTITEKIEALKAAEGVRVEFNPAHTYCLINKLYPTYKMYMNGENLQATTGSDNTAWYFTETETENQYYIRNVGTLTYAGTIAESTQMTSVANAEHAYTLSSINDYYWTMQHSDAGGSQYIHCNGSYKMVGWSATDGSQWILEVVLEDAVPEIEKNAVLMAQAQELLDDVTIGDISLTTDNFYCNAPYKSDENSGDYSVDYVEKLTDGNVSTFLHTTWNESSVDGAYHYLRVDLGEGHSIKNITFGYTTASRAQCDMPGIIEVEEDDDTETETYTTVATISEGLPNTLYKNVEYTSANIHIAGKRYVRFKVTGIDLEREFVDNHPYFTMSEFCLRSNQPNAKYEGSVTVEQATATFEKILATKSAITSTTVEELQEAYSALNTEYEALLAQKEAARTAAKDDLQKLIDSANDLVELVAEEVTTAEHITDIKLTTDNFYCNAPHLGSGGDYSADYVTYLTDNNTSTILHTRYNGDSDDGNNHYLRVDLGEGHTVRKIKFSYYTGVRSYTDMPKVLVVEESDEAIGTDTYTSLITLTAEDGLPQETGNAVEYKREEAIGISGKRYLRFKVTDTGRELYDVENGHKVFTMAEFALQAVRDSVVSATKKDAYVNTKATEAMIVATADLASITQTLVGVSTISIEEINEAAARLQAAYDELNAAKDESLYDMAAGKAELLALIEQTTELYNEVGDVTEEYTWYTLQRDNSGEAYYISSNAGQNSADGNSGGTDDGAGIAGLLDSDASTYFHSRWGGTAISEPHYLQIDLGAGNTVTNFVFEYETRKADATSNTSPAPTTIEVRAGNDVAALGDAIVTLTKDADGLPAYSDLGASWSSNIITASEASRYIRLTVTSSDGPGGEQWEEQYFFAMGGLRIADINQNHFEATVKNEYLATTVTEELIVAAADEVKASNIVYNNEEATSEDVENAKAELQADYDALIAAKNSEASTSIEILKSTGTGLSASSFAKNWASNELIGDAAALTLSVGANNMKVSDDDDNLRLYVGTASAGCAYTLTPAAGYYIASYSFKYVSVGGFGESDSFTITVGENTYTVDANTSTTEWQSVTEVVSQPVYGATNALSFSMVGSNKGVIVDDFIVVLKPIAYCDVTYNYIYDSAEVGSETQTAAIGGAYPAPATIPHGYKLATEGYVPDGTVSTADALKEIEVAAWSIAIGEELDDFWDTTSWTMLDAVPEGITNAGIVITDKDNTEVTEVWAKSMPITIDDAGCFKVDFERFTGGNNRLQIVGVDLLDESGAVVASDYHFGFRGNAKSNNVYLLNVSAAGTYTMRYIVCFHGENNTSSGDIAISMHSLKSIAMDGSITDNWTIATWSGLSAIPEYITNNVVLGGGDAVTTVHMMESYVAISDAGLLNTTYTYDGGANRVDIVGTDLLDACDNVIASDYHFGYRGSATYNNVYTFAVSQTGIYKMRYMVCFQNESNTSNGHIDVALSDIYTPFVELRDSVKASIDGHAAATVGCYTVDSRTALNTIYEGCKDYTEETADTDLCAAYQTLVEQLKAMEYIAPDESKFYVIRSASTNDYCTTAPTYVNADNTMKWHKGYDSTLSNAIWQFESDGNGGYHIKNLHTDTYIGSDSWGAMSNTPASVTIEYYTTDDPQVRLLCSGREPMHAQAYNEEVVGWPSGVNSASVWHIEEVSDLSAVHYDMEVVTEFATLKLAYDAVVPEGISAYIGVSVANKELGRFIDFTEVTDVIPAGTAVVLQKTDAESASFSFKYSATAGDADVSANMLEGALYNSTVACHADSCYYMLLTGDEGEAFYWVYEEYSADGTIADGNAETDKGEHILCKANRAYLPLYTSDANNIIAFGLRFGGTTGVEDVKDALKGVDGIYDLTGRKLESITEPGIYIVNGRKLRIK